MMCLYYFVNSDNENLVRGRGMNPWFIAFLVNALPVSYRGQVFIDYHKKTQIISVWAVAFAFNLNILFIDIVAL